MFIKSILFDQITPIALFDKLQKEFEKEPIFMFESAINSESGSSSFIFLGAKERLTHKNGKTLHVDESKKSNTITPHPLDFLKQRYATIQKDEFKELSKKYNISFADGFVGYIGYDSVKLFEPKLVESMSELKSEIDIPQIDLIRPEIVCEVSHKKNTLTIFTMSPSYAKSIDRVIELVSEAHQNIAIKKSEINKSNGRFTLSKERFFEIIDSAKQMIRSGDVFQILISNRFTQYANIDFLSFYRVLRSKNPSPYMFLLNFRDFAIIGSSPEVMVGLKNECILLRPIAGTRKRGRDLEHDLEMEKELLSDTKERAEHLMLIDLGRNDVGRVAKVGSVKVPQMMRVERYSHVMHLVSDVIAHIDPKKDMFDLFKATFTAGTMTGAPKIRAMELIAQFEGVERSFYSGAVGYFGYDGNMDSAIMIRTAYLDSEKIIFQAGAGIVADSKNELEYLEVQNKLGALMSTLEDLKK